MKPWMILLATVWLVGSSRAQIFTPESFGGAAVGAGAGAIIGNQFDGQAGAGAAIGAGVGYLLGEIVHARRHYPAPAEAAPYDYSVPGYRPSFLYTPNRYSRGGYYAQPVMVPTAPNPEPAPAPAQATSSVPTLTGLSSTQQPNPSMQAANRLFGR